jgi:hypothetical protein
MASVTFEKGGRELPEIFLVPPHDRPSRARKHHCSQLEQVQEAARRVEQSATDFLQGDTSRFAAREAASAIQCIQLPGSIQYSPAGCRRIAGSTRSGAAVTAAP